MTSVELLVAAIKRCLDAGLAPRDQDAFHLATLVWTAEHGITMGRISRPTFPWPALDALVDEMVDRLLAFQ